MKLHQCLQFLGHIITVWKRFHSSKMQLVIFTNKFTIYHLPNTSWVEHSLLCLLLCQRQPSLVSTRLTSSFIQVVTSQRARKSMKRKSRNFLIIVAVEDSTYSFSLIQMKFRPFLVHLYTSQYKKHRWYSVNMADIRLSVLLNDRLKTRQNKTSIKRYTLSHLLKPKTTRCTVFQQTLSLRNWRCANVKPQVA